MMKKILAAFDGLRLSQSTLQYSINIAKQNDSHLVGVFLEDYTYHSYRIYELITEDGGGMDTKRRHLDKKDEKTRAAAIAGFETACKEAGIEYSIHKDRNFALRELLRESIYGDLLVIDRAETLAHHSENTPTHFMRDLLADIQCPVLVVPSEFYPVDQLVLLYDGAPSSVHAIKMLCYTLDHLQELPVRVVTVNSFRENMNVPDAKLIREFAKRHYPKAEFITLKGLAETEILDFLGAIEGFPIVALGAYRRSKVSRWLKASLADVLMTETKFPLFIAHNK
jgi:nucleotide-binding universal stress UspA family protein